MGSILVVEDSSEVQILLQGALRGLSEDIQFASTAKEAQEKLADQIYSLVLLDISLPDRDGMEIFSEMRADERLKTISVIFLTGKMDLSTKIAAFALGAEDYVMKPFNPLELRARVEAKLKRVASQINEGQTLCRGSLKLDSSTQRVYELTSGQPILIHLTPREFNLLFQLAKNGERVVSREQLLRAVWGDTAEVFDRAVDTHISSIRKKLGPFSTYIESVTGAGYRFTSAVHSKSKKSA